MKSFHQFSFSFQRVQQSEDVIDVQIGLQSIDEQGGISGC